MNNDERARNPLQMLPAVNAVLEHPVVRELVEELGRETVLQWVREQLATARSSLQEMDHHASQPEPSGLAFSRTELLEEIAEGVSRAAQSREQTRFGRVINATGVILHTNLGRSSLSEAAKSALTDAAGSSNLELDLDTGERRYRGHQLLPLWQQLTGTEDALVVNNNAGATLLTLQSLSRQGTQQGDQQREVIISRGQLIEIGGSFRLPDIFELSGTILREVGTTNRTRIEDYARAITENTVAILHVHPSNYRIEGFTSTPDIHELVKLARTHNLICIDDIGSGALLNVTQWGLPPEPTFTESIAAGADLVLGSGDKLLGGPQAGIILGRQSLVDQIRHAPLARTMRIGKLTLAALAATLESYQRGTATKDLPTLQLLSQTLGDLIPRAQSVLEELLAEGGELPPLTITLQTARTPIGGGSLPGAELPTATLAIEHATKSAEQLARLLRLGSIRIIPRIHQQKLILDFRSIPPQDDSRITLAIRLLAQA